MVKKLNSIPVAWPNPDCSVKLFCSDEGAKKLETESRTPKFNSILKVDVSKKINQQ